MGRGRGKGRKGRNEEGLASSQADLRESQLPPGPGSLEEVLDFPDFLFERLFRSEAGGDGVHRMRQVLGSGLQLSSQYNGKGTAETCAAHLFSKLVKEQVFASDGPMWKMATAFDLKQFAIDVLRHHDASSKPHCVFGDMQCFLSPEARKELDRLMPAKMQKVEEKLAAFESMDKFLKQNLASALPTDRLAPCFNHTSGDGCPVWPERDLKTFTVWVAGQTCKDVSRRGSRQGFAGPRTKAYIVWVNMIRKDRPDMFIHEITCSEEAQQRLRDDLGDLYSILTCDSVSPRRLGIPVQRVRQYSVGVLQSKFVHVGSWQEFADIMASRCQVSGDIFFMADELHRSEVSKRLAQRNGWYTSGAELPVIEDQLTPAEQGRMRD